MAEPKPKRKTRSDKFPLTLHPTKQYCKKINGRLYYFGTDRQAALRKYLRYASELHRATGKPAALLNREDTTLKELCNMYLSYQSARAEAGDLTAQYYADQVRSLRNLARYIGPDCWVSEIRTVELQNYRTKLLKSYGSSSGVNINLAIMKSMFHWAKKNEVVASIPNIDAVSKARVPQKERPFFSISQIQKLFSVADSEIKTMMLLGLNCGFGCTDCAVLRWKDLDLDNKRVRLARKKTDVPRNLVLWPETVAALKKTPKSGELVFYTSKGNPWVRTIKSMGKDGIEKYNNDNALSKKFSKLLKKTGIKTEKGVGFYTLRRTAATLAARSGDPFAVQKLLGHADLKMATTYVQDVSEQIDRVVNNVRKLIIQGDS